MLSVGPLLQMCQWFSLGYKSLGKGEPYILARSAPIHLSRHLSSTLRNTILKAGGPVHSFQRLMLRVLASLRGVQIISLAPARVKSCLPQTSSRKVLHSVKEGLSVEITLIQLYQSYHLDWQTCNRHSPSPRFFLLAPVEAVRTGLAVLKR